MSKALPVYHIENFRQPHPEQSFYANNLRSHLKEHRFTNHPHKHDFYLVVLFTMGTGRHEVDFTPYPVKPGALFTMRPGQMHNWDLSPDCQGFVFFHSAGFFEEGFTQSRLSRFPFFSPLQNTALTLLEGDALILVKKLMSDINTEYANNREYRQEKLHALVSLAYIELARSWQPGKPVQNPTYLEQVQKFEELVEKNFKALKLPRDYASLLHISEKHLNRITRSCLNKTSTQLIAERICLEARRMLFLAGLNVTQIADELGFSDKSYFIRFFKKHVGQSPLAFLKRYRQG